jgi:hypothetical protein
MISQHHIGHVSHRGWLTPHISRPLTYFITVAELNIGHASFAWLMLVTMQSFVRFIPMHVRRGNLIFGSLYIVGYNHCQPRTKLDLTTVVTYQLRTTG